MKKYTAYKDSNVEWLREIPEHWKLMKLKWIANIIGGSTPASSKSEYWDGDINWVTTDDLGKLKNKIITTTERKITRDGLNSIGKSLSPIGALVVSNRAPIGHIGILAVDAATNQGCKSIVLDKEVNSGYYYYLILTTKDVLDSLGRGTTFKELSTQSLKYFVVTYPSAHEQTTIANFLDHKTQQIDDLIAKKERLIELLKEERIATINHAVTKGIDPNVPMKDSGIEWLGEIPEHWEVNRLKRICKIQGRIGFKGYKKDDLVSTGEGALTLGAKHINKSNKIDLSEPEFIRWEKYYESPEIMIQTGDILVTQRGTLGKVAIVEKELGEATINPSMVLLKKIAINRKYLFYFINSKYFNANVEIISSSTAVPMISQEELGNFFVLVPKISEQEGIANYLNESLDIIDEQINNVQKEITLIKEYKTALINEAVTGKIDIRDYIINHVTI